MPVWAWITLILGGVLLLGALAAAGVIGWRAYVRRALLKLLGKAEATVAAEQGLIDVVERLIAGSDEDIEIFADDPEAQERRVLSEIHARAIMVRDEVDTMPLPPSLVELAEAIGDTAHLTAVESGHVPDDVVGPDALEALAQTDLAFVASHASKVKVLLAEVCEECGVEDTAVYGGGLYL